MLHNILGLTGMDKFIGVFWIYRDSIFGCSTVKQNGVMRVSKIIDSNFEHATEWQKVLTQQKNLPSELKAQEYFSIPRGRVLYNDKNHCHIVYLDRKLNNLGCRELISRFFQFEISRTIWRNDLHYTTDEIELGDIFME